MKIIQYDNYTRMNKTVLYNKGRQWSIETDGCMNTIRWGNQKTIRTSIAKNIGKCNETTPNEQAIKDAQSLINKKIKNGYTRMIDGKSSKSSIHMDLHRYKPGMKIATFVQEKLDGVRGLWINGEMYTRRLVVIKRLVNIKDELGRLEDHISATIPELSKRHIQFDGELYIRNSSLQFIAGIVNTKILSTNTPQLQYWIFDMPSSKPFFKRLLEINIVKKAITSLDLQHIKIVPTEFCPTESSCDYVYNMLVRDGAEGVVVRTMLSPYMFGKRSRTSVKRKPFIDSEYTIIDILEGTGKLVNHAGSLVLSDKKVTFNVLSPGTMTTKSNMFTNKSEYIGKTVKVKYQGLTNKGIPRNPVVINMF